MYEGPIELFSVEDYSKQIDEQIEKAVYEVVMNVGINVNREELIKALEYDRNQYEKGYADGKKNNIEWIPVTERLPEETGWYLCTLPMCFSEDSLVDTFRFETENGNFWSGGIEYNVAAWMPLPKPYKEGE